MLVLYLYRISAQPTQSHLTADAPLSVAGHTAIHLPVYSIFRQSLNARTCPLTVVWYASISSSVFSDHSFVKGIRFCCVVGAWDLTSVHTVAAVSSVSNSLADGTECSTTLFKNDLN